MPEILRCQRQRRRSCSLHIIDVIRQREGSIEANDGSGSVSQCPRLEYFGDEDGSSMVHRHRIPQFGLLMARIDVSLPERRLVLSWQAGSWS